MKIGLMKNCLHYFQLRQGTILIAILQLVLSGYITIFIILGLSHESGIQDMIARDTEDVLEREALEEITSKHINSHRMELAHHNATEKVYLIYCGLVIVIVHFISTLLLLYGSLMVAPIVIQIIDDDDLDERMQLRLVKRQLRDESNPFDIEEEQFRKHYRMVQLVMMDLIDRLIPFLPYHQHGVPPHLQVLATVRFMAEGSYQKGLGQDFNHPMCQSSISKYLHIVIPAIIRLSEQFIRFPTTEEERQILSDSFEQHLGFPGVISLIDCTLIDVHKPSEHEEAFLDHHQNHSMNVQVLCDLHYNIQNLRICNGSTHDAFVWRNSEARAEMITLRQEADNVAGRRYFIIGDSGYTQSPYILTPINEAPPASPEFEYSQVIRRTRCRVEQLFGIWKEVIRCLNGERTLHYGPEFAAQIVRAGAVLYNILRHHGMPMPVAPRINEQRRVNPVFVDDDYVQGVAIRQEIIDEYFRRGQRGV